MNRHFLRPLLAVGVFLFMAAALSAQAVSPQQAQQLLQNRPDLLNQLRQRIGGSGLSPDQIRARLRAQGYPDNLLDSYLQSDGRSGSAGATDPTGAAAAGAAVAGTAGSLNGNSAMPTSDVFQALRELGIADSSDFDFPGQSIPLPDASIDVVFCYAAAHHFVDHEPALTEAWRVLRPGGWCLWLYEPTSSALFRGLAEARVNRKRTDVKEHVLIPATVLGLARAIGFHGQVTFWPHALRRGRVESLYYLGLSFLPWLAPVMPCTAHFSLQRPVT